MDNRLRLYETKSDYLNEYDSLTYPTVSFIEENQSFKKKERSYLFATYKVTDTSAAITLLGSRFDISQISAMYIDGERISSPVATYTFSTLGQHTVKMICNDNMTNCNYMFDKSFNLVLLQTDHWNTSSVQSTLAMFQSCSGLTSLDFSQCDFSELMDMAGMFMGCDHCTSIILPSTPITKVNSLNRTFTSCKSLITVDMSSIDTSNVTTMLGLFGYCNKLETVDVSHFNTNNVTQMTAMFNECGKLKSVDVSNFNTSKVTDMSYMFYGCSGLTSLDVSSFNTSGVTNMYAMFMYCGGLTSLNVSNFNTSNVTDMSGMFSECDNITTLDLSNFNTSKVTTILSLFWGCNKLSTVNIGNFNTSQCVNMHGVFCNCPMLTSLDISTWDLSKVTDGQKMFSGCTSLTSVTMNTSLEALTNTDNMFGGINTNGTFYCNTEHDYTKIINVLPSTWSVNDGTQMENCIIATYTITGTTQSVTVYASSSYFDSTLIEKIYIDEQLQSSITSAYTMSSGEHTVKYVMKSEGYTSLGRMFYSSFPLSKVDLTYFDCSNITSLSGMFSTNLIAQYTSTYFPTPLQVVSDVKLNTANVTNMSNMFQGRRGIIIDVSIFDTSNVTNMSGMFEGFSYYNTSARFDSSITNLSTLDVSKVTNMSNMFNSLKIVSDLDISTWAATKVTNSKDMFKNVGLSGNIIYNSSLLTDKIIRELPYMYYAQDVNPSPSESSISVQYNISSTTATTQILGSGFDLTQIEKIVIDNSTALTEPVSAYTFSQTGTSNVKFIMKQPTQLVSYANMFYGCNTIKTINMSSLNVINVSNMEYLFYNCINMTSLTLFNKNHTRAVVDMSNMFENCNVLTSLNLSDLQVSNVTDMSYMFKGCNALTSINLTNWTASSVTNANYMFCEIGVTSTTQITNFTNVISGMSKVNTMANTFAGTLCSTINITLPSSVKNVEGLFATGQCTSITISGSAKPTNCNTMFGMCQQLTSFSIPSTFFNNATGMTGVFCQCTSLQTVNLSGHTLSSATSLTYTFGVMTSVTTIRFPKNSNLKTDVDVTDIFVSSNENACTLYVPSSYANTTPYQNIKAQMPSGWTWKTY